MGMAHLLGQLSLKQNPTIALPLLHRAATLATLQVPQPAYVYALLLLSEFTQIAVPLTLFAPFIPPSSSPTLEARKHLERAAFLHFPAAQYKLGHAYEFAEPPFPFDPLLSVQYYSLASEQGEAEADMALSKWFLCGSGGAAGDIGPAGAGAFEKDEALALTFAEKAAKKGLPSAEFAMGYYAEVGVGRPTDIQAALGWYQLVRFHSLPLPLSSQIFPVRLTNMVTRTPQSDSQPCQPHPVNPSPVKNTTQSQKRNSSVDVLKQLKDPKINHSVLLGMVNHFQQPKLRLLPLEMARWCLMALGKIPWLLRLPKLPPRLSLL